MYDINSLVGQQMAMSNSTNSQMPAPLQDALSSGSNETDTTTMFVDETSDAGRFTVASISFAYFINILLLLLSQVSLSLVFILKMIMCMGMATLIFRFS